MIEFINEAKKNYDVILFDGAVEDVPKEIFDQLAAKGRLLAILASGGAGKACVYTHHGDVITERKVFDAGTPLLPGFESEKTFSF